MYNPSGLDHWSNYADIDQIEVAYKEDEDHPWIRETVFTHQDCSEKAFHCVFTSLQVSKVDDPEKFKSLLNKVKNIFVIEK